jgi:hypothetical protein
MNWNWSEWSCSWMLHFLTMWWCQGLQTYIKSTVTWLSKFENLPHFSHFATNHSTINSLFSGMQIQQLSYKGTVTRTSVDLSCPPIKQLAKSIYVFTFSPALSTRFCRGFSRATVMLLNERNLLLLLNKNVF